MNNRNNNIKINFIFFVIYFIFFNKNFFMYDKIKIKINLFILLYIRKFKKKYQ